MEVIRISDSKLKVMLSEEDMERFDLCRDDLDYDNTETRRALWEILDEAKKETGFDAARERVLIQMFRGKRGGCELFVTKVSAASENTDRRLRKTRTNAYLFSDAATLLSMCEKLYAQGYRDKSEIYHMGNRFCLIIEERENETLLVENSLGEYGFLSEYGERRHGNLTLSYVREHGEQLEGEHAVERLAVKKD